MHVWHPKKYLPSIARTGVPPACLPITWCTDCCTGVPPPIGDGASATAILEVPGVAALVVANIKAPVIIAKIHVICNVFVMKIFLKSFEQLTS